MVFRRFPMRRRRFGTSLSRRPTSGLQNITAREFFAYTNTAGADILHEHVLVAGAQWQVEGVDTYRSNAVVRSIHARFLITVQPTLTTIAATTDLVHWMWQLYVIDKEDPGPTNFAAMSGAPWRNHAKILREGIGSIAQATVVSATNPTAALVTRGININVSVKGPIKISNDDLVIWAITFGNLEETTPWAMNLGGFSTARIAKP